MVNRGLIVLGVWCLIIIQVRAQLSTAQVDSMQRVLNVSPNDTNRIKLLLELGHHKLVFSENKKSSQDSALTFFQQASTLSKRLGNRLLSEESLCQIGTYYLQTESLEQGRACFRSLIRVYQHEGNKAGESKIWFKMGNGFVRKENHYTEILSYYRQALNLAEQLHNQQQQILILSAIGEIRGIQGNLKQAETAYLGVLAIQKSIGDIGIYRTYFSLSNLRFYQGDFNNALSYCLKMIVSVETIGNNSELDYAYFRLGNVYFELGQIDKSIEGYKKSLAISRQKGQVIVEMGMAKKLARALLKQDKAPEALRFLRTISHKHLSLVIEDKMILAESFGECYAALKQVKLAERYYLESIELSKKNVPWQARVADMGISRFYVGLGQYAKAKPYLRQLLAAPRGQVPATILMEVHWLQFKVDSAVGDYLSAIDHFRQHKTLNDSIFSQAKSRQLEELQVQYETDQKEHRIQLLTEKGQRQQSELKRGQITRNGIIAGAILLLLLLGLGYNQYRLKQRTNQLLEAKQREINQKNESLTIVINEKDQLITEKEGLLTEKDHLLAEKEWMLKEIHHRVKNNLQIISSLLHSQGVYLKDEAALSAIRESQNRVHVMALTHQKLYQSDQFATVQLAEYVEEIVEYLIITFDRQDTVQKQVKATTVELDVTLAVPLGLIINEAVTNSLKHAFPLNRRGLIQIDLTKPDNYTYQLTLSDNGVGFPEELNHSQSRTLGLSLIRGLSKQLGGTLQINQHNGVQISLTFRDEKIT